MGVVSTDFSSQRTTPTWKIVIISGGALILCCIFLLIGLRWRPMLTKDIVIISNTPTATWTALNTDLSRQLIAEKATSRFFGIPAGGAPGMYRYYDVAEFEQLIQERCKLLPYGGGNKIVIRLEIPAKISFSSFSHQERKAAAIIANAIIEVAQNDLPLLLGCATAGQVAQGTIPEAALTNATVSLQLSHHTYLDANIPSIRNSFRAEVEGLLKEGKLKNQDSIPSNTCIPSTVKEVDFLEEYMWIDDTSGMR